VACAREEARRKRKKKKTWNWGKSGKSPRRWEEKGESALSGPAPKVFERSLRVRELLEVRKEEAMRGEGKLRRGANRAPRFEKDTGAKARTGGLEVD